MPRNAKMEESVFKKTVANVQEDITGIDVNFVSSFISGNGFNICSKYLLQANNSFS